MDSKKTKTTVIAIFLVLFVVFVFFMITKGLKNSDNTNVKDQRGVMNPSHPLNATYNIGGTDVTLDSGQSDVQISNSFVATSLWGEPISNDVNGDTLDFWTVILSQVRDGSTNLYYVSACVGGGDNCDGTNSILLGDRIVVKDVLIEADGTILVDYAHRPDGAPDTEKPSVDVSRRFTIIDTVLKEVLGS